MVLREAIFARAGWKGRTGTASLGRSESLGQMDMQVSEHKILQVVNNRRSLIPRIPEVAIDLETRRLNENRSTGAKLRTQSQNLRYRI